MPNVAFPSLGKSWKRGEIWVTIYAHIKLESAQQIFEVLQAQLVPVCRVAQSDENGTLRPAPVAIL